MTDAGHPYPLEQLRAAQAAGRPLGWPTFRHLAQRWGWTDVARIHEAWEAQKRPWKQRDPGAEAPGFA